MNKYWINGLSIIRTFIEWKVILYEYCENCFKEENTCINLKNTLKQGNISFEEYFYLFFQRKNQFCIKEASLIDAINRNVSYFKQFFTFN